MTLWWRWVDVCLLHGQLRMKRGVRPNAVWHIEQLSSFFDLNKSVYAAFCSADRVITQIVLLSRTDAKREENELNSFILVWKPSLRSTSTNATLNVLCFLESFWRFKPFSNIKTQRTEKSSLQMCFTSSHHLRTVVLALENLFMVGAYVP